MGLCNQKPQVIIYKEPKRMENSLAAAKPFSHLNQSELEMHLHHNVDQNAVKTQEDEQNIQEVSDIIAKSFNKQDSYPEHSLLSHSNSDHFDMDCKFTPSPTRRIQLQRACSDTTYRLVSRRKSQGEEKLRAEIQVEATKDGVSL
jgi:hypothetical protein